MDRVVRYWVTLSADSATGVHGNRGSSGAEVPLELAKIKLIFFRNLARTRVSDSGVTA